jgi:hypothetical protein
VLLASGLATPLFASGDRPIPIVNRGEPIDESL